MSKIDKLLAELCPHGVEFRNLDEIFDIRNGYTPSKAKPEYWTDGTIPWFRMEDIRKNGRVLSDSIQHITPESVKGGKLFPANSIIIATTATIGEHALITVPSLANQRFSFLTEKKTADDKPAVCLDPMFVYYYCFVLAEFCRNNTNVSGFASVDMAKFKKFQFPIPPLKIQQEIVNVLDSFTELEAELEVELEAELEARKKQYAHYRDQLLAFGSATERERERVRWATLEEVAMYSKDRIDATDLDETSYVGVDNILQNRAGKINSQYVPTVGKLARFNEGDVLIGNIRPYLKKIWQADKTGGTNGDVLVVKLNDKDKIMPRYLYQVLADDKFFDYNMQHSKGAKMPRGNKALIMKYKIPIPPLAEQNRIVSILDKFDKLVNDISEGLPAEIKARRQQYEYYRNKLLTFKAAA
jgi:type I restriction enzyme S subunit